MGDNFIISMYNYLGIKLVIALLILFVLILFLIILDLISKKKKTKNKEKTKDIPKKMKLKISSKDPKHNLILLDKKIRDHFKSKLKSESEITYAEITRELKAKNKPVPASFFHKMNYHLYSQKQTTEKEVKNLKQEFLNIIQNKKTKPIKQKPKKETKKKTKPKKISKIKKKQIKLKLKKNP